MEHVRRDVEDALSHARAAGSGSGSGRSGSMQCLELEAQVSSTAQHSTGRLCEQCLAVLRYAMPCLAPMELLCTLLSISTIVLVLILILIIVGGGRVFAHAL